MIMKRLFLAAALPVFALTGCAATTDGEETVVEEQKDVQAPIDNEEEPAEQPVEAGQLLESGFGVANGYAHTIALVENTSETAGQTVTVGFNLLDREGNIITSTDSVQSFSTPGQVKVLSGFAEVKNAKVASMDVTLIVEDSGVFEERETDLGVVEDVPLSSEYGTDYAKVTFENPLEEVLKDPEIQVVCRNRDGDINGGGFTYSGIAPAGGKTSAEIDLKLNGTADKCDAYLDYPAF